MSEYTYKENQEDAAVLASMLKAIYDCSKRVVAKVHGARYAGGEGLIAGCDIVVATDDVDFCLSEVKLGLIPATISPYVISAMGKSKARRYFSTDERFGAHEALSMSFIHTSTTSEMIDQEVASIANSIKAASPNAVKEAKQLVKDVCSAELTEDLIANTVDRIALIRASVGGKEGIQSFLEKRKPNWLQ